MPDSGNDPEPLAREAAARDLLLRHYRRIAQWDPEAVADHALAIPDKAERLAELLAHLPPPPRWCRTRPRELAHSHLRGGRR